MTAHIHTVRVYYADTDAAGVVYHTSYIRFLEQARTESLREVGIELPALFKKYDILFAIKNINISFVKPARLDDLLYIKTSIKEMRQASLVYEQYIYLTKLDGEVICSANVKLAAVNSKLRPCRLPSILTQMEST